VAYIKMAYTYSSILNLKRWNKITKMSDPTGIRTAYILNTNIKLTPFLQNVIERHRIIYVEIAVY
jgi:hypothetical protein